METALRFGDGVLVLAPYGAPSGAPAAPEPEGAPRPPPRPAPDAPVAPAPAAEGAAVRGGLKGMAASAGDLLFSEKNACLYCGLSFDELSPQLFSFNSPIGACPECLGLGSTMEIDLDLVIPDQGKTIREGAVVPWGEQEDASDADTWGERYRAQVLAHYGVSPDVPFDQLPEDKRQLLLHGGKGERVKITWQHKNGSGGSWFSKWEGILPRLRRMLKQASSDGARQHYMQFFAQQPCPACGGAKLRPEARAVTVGGQSLVDVGRLSVAGALAYFEGLVLPEREQTIAAELLKEIRGRLGFLLNVGLHYLTLDRPAPHPVRGGGAADPPGQPDRLWPGGGAVHPGRALHRAAPAGQRQADPDPGGPARHRQHRGGGGARPGDDAAPPTTSWTSAPGRGCTGGRWWPAGHPADIARCPRIAHRAVPLRGAKRSRCPHAAPASGHRGRPG